MEVKKVLEDAVLLQLFNTLRAEPSSEQLARTWELLKKEKLDPESICRQLANELADCLEYRFDAPHGLSDRHKGYGRSTEVIKNRVTRSAQSLVQDMLQRVEEHAK